MTDLARVLVADPPWQYNNRHDTRGKSRFGIGVAARYSRGCMTIANLCAMGPLVQSVCAPDCLAFLWTTPPTMPDAIRLLEAWNFRYVTIGFYWTKTYHQNGKPFFGPGRYTPSNIEPVLLGARGKCWHPNTGSKPLQEIREPHPRLDGKIHHSRKPETLQDRIESWLWPYLGGYGMMELFATRLRVGWDCYGWDVTGRDLREDLADHAAGLVEVAS